MPSPLLFTVDEIRRALQPSLKSFKKIIKDNKGVDESSLLKQLSIHLPRLEDYRFLEVDVILKESLRLAQHLKGIREPYLNKIPITGENVVVKDLLFGEIKNEIAEPILDRFHYLMSYRSDSISLGLSHNQNEWPISITTLSKFDLNNITPALSELKISHDELLVVSRVFLI